MSTTTTANDTAAANVRAEMARRRLTIQQLADGVGWSRSAAARRLDGTQPFKVDDLVAVASFFGLQTAVLLEERAA